MARRRGVGGGLRSLPSVGRTTHGISSSCMYRPSSPSAHSSSAPGYISVSVADSRLLQQVDQRVDREGVVEIDGERVVVIGQHDPARQPSRRAPALNAPRTARLRGRPPSAGGCRRA